MSSEQQEPQSPEIRPMSKGATRVLVTVAIILSLATAALAVYLVLTLSADPDTQRRIEEIQQQEQQATRPDSL